MYLFIYFWLCWVFLAAHRLSLVAESREHSLVVVHRLPVAVASLFVERLLQDTRASVAAACALTSCGWRALEL